MSATAGSPDNPCAGAAGGGTSPLDRLLVTLRRGVPAATAGTAGRAARVAFALLLALAVALPFVGLHVPAILPGTVDVLDSPGTLEVIALCFVFGAVALGYDLLFGFVGLLSFGQALWFATGAYVFDVALSDWHWALAPAVLLALAVALVLAAVLGAIALRVGGIAFAMVTLAFAQAGYYVIEQDPHNLTGGDSGLVLATARLPGALVGVDNTRNLYFVALGFLLLSWLVVRITTESATGRVWLAIRENERRAEVLGLRPYGFKLAAFCLSCLVAAGGGMAYDLVVGTAAPSAVATTTVTISLLVMVVLGGVGTRWGAVLGASVYVYLQQLLVKVAAEPSFAGLPAPLRVPLAQPQFLLGAVFVCFVLFAPGGLAGLVASSRLRLSRRRA